MSNPMATPGAFSWVELMTTDPESAKKFYAAVFGWTFEKNPKFDYTIIKLGGQMAGGMMPMPPGCPTPAWGNYVTVASADETAAKVKSLGGKVLVAPQPAALGSRFAVITDPTGGAVGLVQYVDNANPGDRP